MPYNTMGQNNLQVDPEQVLILPPISVTIASQTVIDSTLNVKLHGFAVNNTTASAVTLTITDGEDNEILSEASFDGNQLQAVDLKPGYYMKKGIKVLSGTDNGIILWISAKKM